MLEILFPGSRCKFRYNRKWDFYKFKKPILEILSEPRLNIEILREQKLNNEIQREPTLNVEILREPTLNVETLREPLLNSNRHSKVQEKHQTW